MAAGESSADNPGPRIINLNPEEDYSIWIGFFSPAEVKTVAEAEAYVKGMAVDIVDAPKVIRTGDRKMGNLTAHYFSGQGTREGAPVDFTVGIVVLSGGRVAISVFLGENGAREAYQAEVNAIAASFRAEGVTK